MSEHTKELDSELDDHPEEHLDDQTDEHSEHFLEESEEDIPMLEESLTEADTSASHTAETSSDDSSEESNADESKPSLEITHANDEEDDIPTLEMNVDLGYSEEDYISEDDDEAFIIEPSSEITPEPADENIATLEAIVFGGDDPTAPAPGHVIKPLIEGEEEQSDSAEMAGLSAQNTTDDEPEQSAPDAFLAGQDQQGTAEPSQSETISQTHIASEKAQKAAESSQSLEQKLSGSELTSSSPSATPTMTAESNPPLVENSPSIEPPKSAASKGENPFLPKHILERLNQGKRNLVEEIAQSGAALDASTALLRTRARSERLNKPFHKSEQPSETQQPAPSKDKAESKKQKMIDDLVEDYLPLLAAELRRRLKKMLDEQ